MVSFQGIKTKKSLRMRDTYTNTYYKVFSGLPAVKTTQIHITKFFLASQQLKLLKVAKMVRFQNLNSEKFLAGAR